jgi:hypothetical protein
MALLVTKVLQVSRMFIGPAKAQVTSQKMFWWPIIEDPDLSIELVKRYAAVEIRYSGHERCTAKLHWFPLPFFHNQSAQWTGRHKKHA